MLLLYGRRVVLGVVVGGKECTVESVLIMWNSQLSTPQPSAAASNVCIRQAQYDPLFDSPSRELHLIFDLHQPSATKCILVVVCALYDPSLGSPSPMLYLIFSPHRPLATKWRPVLYCIHFDPLFDSTSRELDLFFHLP